jgi:hypothetical protein
MIRTARPYDQHFMTHNHRSKFEKTFVMTEKSMVAGYSKMTDDLETNRNCILPAQTSKILAQYVGHSLSRCPGILCCALCSASEFSTPCSLASFGIG